MRMGIELREGICSNPECPRRTKFIGNRSKMLCLDCNAARLKMGKELRADKKPLQEGWQKPSQKPSRKEKPAYRPKERKATGEWAVFMEIWKERGGKSEISGDRIYQPRPINFMHVLGKGAYPRFRLRKDNIVIGTGDEHYSYDFGDVTKLRQDKRWSFVFEKFEKLKQEYYQSK
jgi:hypothetical protein